VGSATERAYTTIRQGILSGAHAPASHLREEELAAQVGVSRTPVREALRRLAAEGLLEVTPNRGVRVSAWSERDLQEIFELRALLESYGARLAAGRIPAAAVQELAALAERMELMAGGRAPDRLERVAEINNQFHQGVLAAAANDRLVALLGHVVQVPLVQHTFRRYAAAELGRSLAQHREILEALRHRDPAWAESAMRSHILGARNVVGRGFAGGGPAAT